MSQALYRKYRSRSLDEIVGQDHITSLLQAAIDTDSVHHAYLLTGPRGTGKTSIARIIAHAINSLEYSDTSHLDIIEIDAASNNGVDDVRDLRERVHIAPTSAKRKVYIIDEVHMLSKPAFNALLKTLEEPPAHVVFVLATTDIDKVPATILSRVQRFNFRAIAPAAALEHLRTIAKGEGIDIDDSALELIARRGGGSFRDSIGLLDQVRPLAAGGTITADKITAALGIAGEQQLDTLLAATKAGNIKDLTTTLEQLTASGVSPRIIAEQLVERLTASLTTEASALPLIDRLLDVSSSSLPASRLLVALASEAEPATLIAIDKPTQAKPIAKPTTPTPAKEPKAKQSEPAPEPQPAFKQTLAPDGDYKHSQLESATDDVALGSLLKKSGSVLAGTTLTIYTGNKLFARQLDSPARRKILSAVLDSIGYTDITIKISPDKPPLRDSQSAAVAAIMGGGEEVEL